MIASVVLSGFVCRSIFMNRILGVKWLGEKLSSKHILSRGGNTCVVFKNCKSTVMLAISVS